MHLRSFKREYQRELYKAGCYLPTLVLGPQALPYALPPVPQLPVLRQ